MSCQSFIGNPLLPKDTLFCQKAEALTVCFKGRQRQTQGESSTGPREDALQRKQPSFPTTTDGHNTGEKLFTSRIASELSK